MYERPKTGDLEEVKIELTKKCPLSCVHCSSEASSDDPLQLSRESVISLISQSNKMKIKSVAFSGGEPLLWPWISEAVTESHLKGLNSSLYSTGINLNNNGANDINSLAERGLGRVIFSLYSPFKESHEAITRQSGSFGKTTTVMRELRENNIPREIHFVPIKLNFTHLAKLIDLAKELNVKKISILRFVPHGRGITLKNSNEMLSRKETIELRKLILECKSQNDVEIRLGSPYNILILNEDIDCIAARKTICIGPNGNIYPCDAFKSIEPSEIGIVDKYHNILEHSLKECWEKSAYLNAIRGYLTTPFEQPCSCCEHLTKCKSGCLAQKVIDQESIDDGKIVKRADPLCLKSLVRG